MSIKNIFKNNILNPFRFDGRGISKSKSPKQSGLGRFFLTFKDSFNKIFLVNIIMVLGNIPAIFLIAILSGYTRETVLIPTSDLFQNLGGIFLINGFSPSQMAIYAMEGLPSTLLVNTTLTYVFLAIGSLVLFTFGIVSAASTYVLRNIAMGEAVFVWSDFWYAVKRNWKIALPFGIIDILINCLLAFNLYSTVSNGSFATSLMFWSNLIISILYFFMRSYIYIQIVSFDMPIMKIMKNALILSLVGFKRNVMALLGCLLFVILEIFFILGAGGILISLGVAMPLAIMFSATEYMRIYAAFFKIKEHIIDPYLKEHPEEAEDYYDDAIMRDDVTEIERLSEIKSKMNI